MLDKDGMPQTEEVEVKIPAFRAVSVFAVKQTSGEPIPELEAKELLSTVEGYEDFVKGKGQWQDKNDEPQAGDLIFFDWGGSDGSSCPGS